MFTSSLASAAPGVIYWSISYPSSAIAECAAVESSTVTLPVWSVNVLAPASEQRPQESGPAPRCSVPRLRGASLGHARTLLRRAGCRLGHVTRRHVAGRAAVVTSQSPRAGSRRARETAVAVTLGR